MDGERTTIDRAGRIVVPKAIRERLQIGGGAEVEIEEHDGVIEIVPRPTAMVLRATPDGPVAEPRAPLPALTDEIVRSTMERLRR